MNSALTVISVFKFRIINFNMLQKHAKFKEGRKRRLPSANCEPGLGGLDHKFDYIGRNMRSLAGYPCDDAGYRVLASFLGSMQNGIANKVPPRAFLGFRETQARLSEMNAFLQSNSKKPITQEEILALYGKMPHAANK